MLNSNGDFAGLKTLESISSAKRFNAWMYETIKPFLYGRILELGSGIGNISDFLATENTLVVLSDYNIDYCTHLKRKYRENSNITDVLSIDLQDPNFLITYKQLRNNFDTIILLNVIEHLQYDENCVQNCWSLLNPGGRFIVLAPAFSFLFSALDKEIGHYRRYSKNELAALLENNGFVIIKKQYFNAIGITGWLLMNKILRRKTITKNSMKIFDRLVPLAKQIDKITDTWIGLSTIVIGKKI